jgi:hypothetical protein
MPPTIHNDDVSFGAGSTLDMRGAGNVFYKTSSITGGAFAAGSDVTRASLAQEVGQFQLPLWDMRVWDANSFLPATASADDLGIVMGNLPSTNSKLLSSDGASTTVTQYARFQYPLPMAYDPGETVTIRVSAGMNITSDSTATVDLIVYRIILGGASGGDICATAAQSINALGENEKDFTITPTTLLAGDRLDCRLEVAITDSATPSGVSANVFGVEMRVDIRG